MPILNFKDFNTLNESSSSIGEFNLLPKNLQRFFKTKTGASLSKVIGNRNFGIILEGESIFFIINGKKIEFPFIKYVGNSVVLINDKLSDINNYIKLHNDIAPSRKPNIHNGKDILLHAPEGLIKIIKEGPESNSEIHTLEYKFHYYLYNLFRLIRENLPTDTVINPFKDLDLQKNPWIELLNSLGYEISTNPNLVKKGTILIVNNNNIKGLDNYSISILSNGYIRRGSEGKSPQLTTNSDLTRPIYSEEDLNVKLAYITKYFLKDLLPTLSLNKDSVNKIISSLSDGPNLSSPELAQTIIDSNNLKLIASIKDKSPNSELWKNVESLMGTDTADLASDMGMLGF